MSDQLRLWNDLPSVHNVFFAARPDPATATRIVHMAKELSRYWRLPAKPIPPERLHVSLFAVGAFDGGCPPTILEDVRNIANDVSVTPFITTFDRVASFGGGAIVLTGEEGAAGFVTLQKVLSSVMARGGLTRRGRGVLHKSSFTPHVTMMYADRACDAFAIESVVSWGVKDFVLIDSLYGQSEHRTLGRWPL